MQRHFACGNVVHVHDLVDFVTAESQRAGKAAAEYVLSGEKDGENCIELVNGDGIGYTVPQKIRKDADGAEIFFRVRRIFKKSAIVVADGENQIAKFKREHMAPGEMEKSSCPRFCLIKSPPALPRYLLRRRNNYDRVNLHHLPKGLPFKG